MISGAALSSLHVELGRILERLGRFEEALAHYQQAIEHNSKDAGSRSKTRTILGHLGRADEALTAWRNALESRLPRHADWEGYAEFCLFLGREDEYHRARQKLLEAFAETKDPTVADRTARACLLLPLTEKELQQAVALTDLSTAAGRTKYRIVYPMFLFTKGLADYREGNFDRVIATMRRRESSRVLGPAPKLVLAMALHRSGETELARKTMAEAILSYNWRMDGIYGAGRLDVSHSSMPRKRNS